MSSKLQERWWRSMMTVDDFSMEHLIVTMDAPVLAYGMDFDLDSPRTRPDFDFGSISFQVRSMWSSHGETTRAAINGIEQLILKMTSMSRDLGRTSLVMLDEPESGMSPRSCYRLVETLARAVQRIETAVQVIVSAHNPIVIHGVVPGRWETSSWPQVWDMERRVECTPAEYLAAQVVRCGEVDHRADLS